MIISAAAAELPRIGVAEAGAMLLVVSRVAPDSYDGRAAVIVGIEPGRSCPGFRADSPGDHGGVMSEMLSLSQPGQARPSSGIPTMHYESVAAVDWGRDSRLQPKHAMTLDEDDIEAVAARVVGRLRQVDRARGLVDAAALAGILNVDRDWAYAHARELGAIRLGDGFAESG